MFYGASIALYLKAKDLILIGVDGYDGYFKLFNKYDKKYIVTKIFLKIYIQAQILNLDIQQ